MGQAGCNARLAALAVLLMAGSIGASVPAAAQAQMEVRFTWRGVAACSHAPPEFVITGVPAGTSVLRFELQDLQAPNYHHGGGIVRYQGSPAIRAGAFRYNGPCPPPGTRHAYRWTVQALATGGQVLSETSVTQAFPPR